MELIFECTIPGRPYLKKSTASMVGGGRRKRLIYSVQYREWEFRALYEIKRKLGFVNQKFPFKGRVRLECKFCFENHQAEPDLSACYEGIQDTLQRAGVIENDKQIFSHDGSTKVFGGPAQTIVKIFAIG